MTPPAIIHELVARFRANLDSYKRGVYNETQARREFIRARTPALPGAQR